MSEQSGEKTNSQVSALEQSCIGYLDTAQFAADALSDNIAELLLPHDRFFEGSGLSESDLYRLAAYGSSLITHVSDQEKKADAANGDVVVALPMLPERLINGYSGIDNNKFKSTYDTSPAVHLEKLLERISVKPIVKEEIDGIVDGLLDISADLPSIGDLGVLFGLSVVRLIQVFRQPEARERLKANIQFPTSFRDSDPVHQAIMMVSSQLLEGKSSISLINTLRETFSDPKRTEFENRQMINDMTVEIRAVGAISEQLAGTNSGIRQILVSIILAACNRSATIGRQLVEQNAAHQQQLVNQGSAAELLLALEAETNVAATVTAAGRKAQSILNQMNAVYPRTNDNGPLREAAKFPEAITPLHNAIRELETSEQKRLLAVERSAKLALGQQISEQLHTLRAKYLLAKTEIKKKPGHNQLTSMLTGGQVGDYYEGYAAAVGKIEAYDVAGLLYSLSGQLERHDGWSVFCGLFAAVEAEAELSARLIEPRTTTRLAEPVRWLVDNRDFLQVSNNPLFSQVAEELIAYIHAKAITESIGQPSATPISIETLQAIEAVRSRAKQLEVRAFPPGVSNLAELEEDALEMATRPGARIYKLEDERLLALDDLSMSFASIGFDAQLFRLLPGSLNERFPYYALVIEHKTGKIVVAENPKTPNATFVYAEHDPEFATWQEIALLDKTTIKELGGRGMTHSAASTLDRHYLRVADEVTLRILAG